LDLSNAQPLSEPVFPSKGGIRGIYVIPEGFNELHLFVLLRLKFGSPNGFLSHLGRPGGDPDGPFKWDYSFSPDGKINVSVVRTAMAIELQWWNDDIEPFKLVSYLERSIERDSQKIKASIETLDHYKLILNPYIRHKRLVDLAAKELSELIVTRPKMSNFEAPTIEEVKSYGDAFSAYMASIDKQASINLLAVTESAYMAESYLNILLAVLMRPEIRTSKKILRDTLYRKWLDKVERLPLDCLHLAAPNMGDSRLRDAKIMFDLRNKVAHSYPDKEDMKVGEMWFEQSFPVLPAGQPFSEFALALHNQLPSKVEAEFCIEAADKFTTFLSELIYQEVREKVEFLFTSNPIGFNETKGIYGVPFGSHAIVYSGVGLHSECSDNGK